MNPFTAGKNVANKDRYKNLKALPLAGSFDLEIEIKLGLMVTIK